MIDYRGPDSAAIRPSDLARRLGFVALWRGRPINLVGGKPLAGTASNGVTPVLTHLGPAYSLSGSGTGGISMSPVPDSAPFTMLVLARSVTGGTSLLGRVMSTFNGGGGNDWYYDGGSHQIQVFTASTNSSFTLPSSLLTSSTFQCVAISLSGVVGAQTPIAYADGVPVTVSTVAAGSGARTAGGTTLGVGYRPDTTGRQAGGVFVLAAYATRHLSARELAQVTARPDLLLAPRRIWVPVSAGGGTTYDVSLTESATPTDTASALATLAAAMSESASGTDTASAQAVLVAAVSESATATDTPSAVLSLVATLNEAASAADAASAIATLGATVSESVSATDVCVAALAAVAAVSEAASAADSASWSGASYSADLTESATPADAVAAAAQLVAQVAEAGSAADALQTAASLVALITAPASAADSVAAGGSTYSVSLAELAAALDVVVGVLAGSTVVLGQLSKARTRLQGQVPGRPPQVGGGRRNNPF